MYITKIKSYTTVSLKDIKEHLSIDSSDDSYDVQLYGLIKTVINEIEKRTSTDVVPTVNSLEDYSICGGSYRVFQPNISITGSLTGTTNMLTTPVTTQISSNDYVILKGSQYTDIVFKSSYSFDKINISYTSGFNTMPTDLLHAIKIRVGYYFDADKNNTLSTNINESKAFDRLIYSYTNLL